MFDRISDACLPEVNLVPVFRFLTVWIGVRCFIFNGSSKRISAGIQSRSVCGYDLETGSGLSGGICRTVQGKTGCFLSASAYDRLYFSGRLFHNDNRSLRLWGNVPTLVDRIILCDAERGFIFVHCSLRFFRGSKDQGIIFSPCGSDILTKHFFAVIFYGSVSAGDRQGKFQTVFRSKRVNGFIGNFFITNLLDPCILCGNDRQTSAVKRIVSLCFRKSFPGHKILDNLLGKFVIEIGIWRCIFYRRCGNNTVINRIGFCLVIFSLCDISLFQHISKYDITAFGIGFRIYNRIISGRILCDARDHGTFRQSQF